MTNDKNMTPLMRQYWDIKNLHQDKVLMFRMGDFYEMFYDDAVKAAPILGIALTSRNKKSEDETPMCGLPHHAVATPINKLLAHGLKVAICDQVEDPKFAKGIVKRAVTRILTPGMVYDPETLEQSLSNYIACYENETLACADTTTGECFWIEELSAEKAERMLNILPIVELVAAPEDELPKNQLLKSVHTELVNSSAPQAVRRLSSYILSLSSNVELAKVLRPFEKRELNERLYLSPTVLKHLEVFQNSRGEKFGSLFLSVDRTKTSAGARLLRSRLTFPLTAAKEINSRLDRVQNWLTKSSELKKIREVLSGMGDIERRVGKIAQPQCHGRDLLALADSTQSGVAALKMAQIPFSSLLELQELSEEIIRTIVEEPALTIRSGFMIKTGVNTTLDEYIRLSTDSQTLLNEMEIREKEKTGISSLKIRYNNVFGYYIEVTHTHKDKVPARYMRKQTLSNAERFCTDELNELERKVLAAQTQRSNLEYEIFEALKNKILQKASKLLQLAQSTAELDVETSSAWLALERQYSRPNLGFTHLRLLSSRHACVEQNMKTPFVPNDITIDQRGVMLLTGPNMAGKSTIMRQVALTVIMAQAGLYVPAKSAELPVFDQIFTRIGANDFLNEGLSTFMVEMTETSEMLKKATAKSLLILDEVGRGTSTYDGMSLAQSILEYIIEQVGAISLFATHYHELTRLQEKYPNLKNAHMSVVEQKGEIQFKHTLVSGPALKSYGIQVGRLAGLPVSVTQRAQEVLKAIEKKSNSKSFDESTDQLSLMSYQTNSQIDNQSEDESTLKSNEYEELMKEILGYPITTKSPIEAMNQIAEWQKKII